MDTDSLAYLVAHYIAMIALIFVVLVVFETAGFDVPLWLGVALAILIGLVYPRAVAALGIAPDRWA